MHPEGHPHLRPEPKLPRAAEPSRGDAENGEAGSVDADDSPGDRRIGAEARAPGVIADHRERVGANGATAWREEAAERRLHFHQREIVLADQFAPNHVARLLRLEIERRAHLYGEIGKHAAAIAVVEKILIGERARLPTLGLIAEQRN